LERGHGGRVLHLGVDDLDTFGWGCTTYYVYTLIKEISRSSVGSRVELLDYPLLTRLNPSIPLRTRGNGALSIHISGEESDLEEVVEIATSLLDVRAMPGREPGVVSILGDIPVEDARKIYTYLLTDIAEIYHVERLVRKLGGRIHVAGRGVIGAIGSISHYYIEGDCTYELIAYSQEADSVYIDPGRLARMDLETRPLTFNNIDPETGKPLIAPSTGAPVVLGIRGETPEILFKAFEILGPRGVSGYALFKTNQGTDQHLIPRPISGAKYYRTGLFTGRVVGRPRVVRGGDVILRISDGAYSVDVAIYREAGGANDAARSLIEGDVVAVGGSVKPWIVDGSEEPVINTETLKILKLAELYVELPLECPKCGASMESMGKGKGFRCRRCGYRDPRAFRTRARVERRVTAGVYKPPPRNMKHLTKPPSRYGLEKVCRPRRPRMFPVL